MTLSHRQKQALPKIIGLLLFFAALAVLRGEIRSLSWPSLMAGVMDTPRDRLLAAAALTLLNYAALTGYDLLAFAHIGRRLPRWRIAGTAFLAYAMSNTIGFAMLTGASLRYRFYSRWGVSAADLSRIILSYTVTFWLGLLVLGGASLFFGGALPGPLASPLMAPVAILLIVLPFAYVGAAMLRREPIRVASFEIPLPPPGVAVAQLAVSAIEWTLAAAVLFALLPPAVPFITFVAAFLVAILVGMASHIPGGMGVFETVIMLLLAPYYESAAVLPALVMFRVVYYLVPLVIALAGLVLDEAWQRRAHVARIASGAGRITAQLTPPAMAALTFIAGVVLLVSGATPAAPGRLAELSHWLPVGVIEISHFTGSVVGVMLLVLSQGLARRLDAAYYLTMIALTVAAAASLLKGIDYEEASLLVAMLAVLGASRPAFDRKAAFFDTRFSAEWVTALVIATAGSFWLMFFAFQHVDYSNQLWWQFELHGEASRALRASVGVALVTLLFALARLMSHARHEAPVPTEQDLEDAARIIATQPNTSPLLVFLRDKSLIFNEARTAFLMYAVQGRSWVALGDPVGPPDEGRELIRQFLERCDDYGGVPVFYEIGPTQLHLYADFGLRFVKIGEAAHVDLTTFRLTGGVNARYRQALRRVEKSGATFRVLATDEVVARIAELRDVSDEWLQDKAVAEKGFSLGFFDEAYVKRFPAAVIEANGRILAFANLWTTDDRSKLSIDLMRFRHDAPPSVMESLIVHVLQWGHEHGYQSFALGMAPLSGMAPAPGASMWNRLGSLIYEYGEAVYNFQGLRAFKEKFNPEWQPHYLAYPGGLRLPRIMADVSALVAGGYRHIFSK